MGKAKKWVCSMRKARKQVCLTTGKSGLFDDERAKKVGAFNNRGKIFDERGKAGLFDKGVDGGSLVDGEGNGLLIGARLLVCGSGGELLADSRLC
jgi:hypothetical protein